MVFWKNKVLPLPNGLDEVAVVMTGNTCFPAGHQKRLKRLAEGQKYARQIMSE
ncbi:MAG: hypothetical protein ACYCUI_15325 [Vulcanimicrobiaceae bacterium]